MADAEDDRKHRPHVVTTTTRSVVSRFSRARRHVAESAAGTYGISGLVTGPRQAAPDRPCRTPEGLH